MVAPIGPIHRGYFVDVRIREARGVASASECVKSYAVLSAQTSAPGNGRIEITAEQPAIESIAGAKRPTRTYHLPGTECSARP